MSMSEKVGALLGNKLGRVIEVKTDDDGFGLGSSLRVRVEIDIRKPLKQRLKLLVEGETDSWVDLKYDRLPSFCFCCGVIGHNAAVCEKGIHLKKETGKISLEYGSWLKTEPKQRNPFIRTGGNFSDRTPSRPMSKSKHSGEGGEGLAAGGGNSSGGLVEIDGDIIVIPAKFGRDFKIGEEGKMDQSSKQGSGQIELQQISEGAEKSQEDQRKVSDVIMTWQDMEAFGLKEKALVEPSSSLVGWAEPNASTSVSNVHPQPISLVDSLAD